MILEMLVVAVPSLLGIGAMAWITRSFVNKETETGRMLMSKEMEGFRNKLQLKNREITLPLRLAAYERMILFCSRIELGSIVQRVEPAKMSVRDFKMVIIGTIEEEFSHNITQQMYMSEDLWSSILLAKLEAISIVEMVASQVGEDKDSVELLRGLMLQTEKQAQVGYLQAQSSLKKEVALLF